MRITAGCTRIVILTERFAIKIARFRLLTALAGGLVALISRRRLEELLERHSLKGKGLAKTLLFLVNWILSIGMDANRREYRLYRDHPYLPIAPVTHLFLWGLVIIQARGEAVDAKLSSEFRSRFLDKDLSRPEHVCRIGTRLCFVDYGNAGSEAELLRQYI